MKYLLILLVLTSCSTIENSYNNCPTTKTWTTKEQIEIAKERNAIAGHPFIQDKTNTPVSLILTPVVFDDWERMRRELRACQ